MYLIMMHKVVPPLDCQPLANEFRGLMGLPKSTQIRKLKPDKKKYTTAQSCVVVSSSNVFFVFCNGVARICENIDAAYKITKIRRPS